MINKIVIPVLILTIAVLGFKLMNSSGSSSPGSKRPATTQSATQTQASNQPSRPTQTGQSTPQPDVKQAQQSSKETPADQANSGNETPDKPTQPTNQQAPRGGSGMRTGVLAKQGATSVEVINASVYQGSAQLKLFGVVEAQEKATITASSTATVSAIHVSEGQLVSPNTKLVTLSASSTSEALTQKKSALIEIEARIRNEALKHENDIETLAIERELLRIAKNSVDRFNSLNSKQLSSGSDYESALRAYQSQLLSVQNRELTLAQYPDQQKQSQAQRNSLLSQIKQSQELVDNLTPMSSFSGFVAKLPVNLGQQLRSGDTIAELYNPDSLALFVRVPQRYRLDQLDINKISATDSLGNIWQAKSIRPVNEFGAQRVTLVPNNDQRFGLLPGTHQSLALNYPLNQTTASAVEVPITAVYDQNRVYLFKQGTITAVNVSIEGQTESGFLISAPELNNERAMIVTTRIKNPVSGMSVSLVGRSGRGQ